jgi:hypothetical protein
MQAQPNVGDHVRVHPSGETGHVVNIMNAADGRATYQIEFDDASAGNSRGGTGETGGLYVLEDLELVREVDQSRRSI